MKIKFPPDMSDEQKEFIEDYFALMHMEESENPDLYRQVQELVN